MLSPILQLSRSFQDISKNTWHPIIKKIFTDIPFFRVSFRFLMVWFQPTFRKILPLNSLFQELFNDIFYFCLAQTVSDFKIFICLIDIGKVWIENGNVSTQVVFNYFEPFDFFQNYFSRKMIDMKLKILG